jgi:hypothetical protein
MKTRAFWDIYSRPATRHGGAWGERKYSSYSFTISALDGGEWSASRPDRALPPGKGPPVPIGEEAGWTPEPVWTFWDITPCNLVGTDRRFRVEYCLHHEGDEYSTP